MTARRRDRAGAASLLRAFAAQPVWRYGVQTLPGPWTENQRALATGAMIAAAVARRPRSR